MTHPTPPAPVTSVAVTSARKAIRLAVAARLAETVGTQGGVPVWRTACGPRVYSARARPLHPGILPAILVYARDEPIPPPPDGHSITGEDGSKTRDLALAVEIVAQLDEGLDDALDLISAQVEAALDDFVIAGWESATILLESTEIGVNAKGEAPIGAGILTWRIRHRTPWRPRAPGTPVETVTLRGHRPDGSLTVETIIPEG